MATDLVEINTEDPQPEALERAAAAVRRGKVVAIPTDALYTLVADPFNLRAVTGVYQAKGREPHRALPILIRGKNGIPFQVLGMVHPRLRTAALPAEMLNKRGKSVEIRIGGTIEPARIATLTDDAEATRYLRLRTELLARRAAKVETRRSSSRRASSTRSCSSTCTSVIRNP